jgi:hypothetical protein
MKRWLYLVLILAVACSKNPTSPSYQKEVSLYGYLWGGQRLSADRALLLTWTRPITDYYNLNDAAIDNAQVLVTEQETGRTFVLHNTTAAPAYYYNDSLLVQPGYTYSVTVHAKDRTVTAATRVPQSITLTTSLATDSSNRVRPTNLGYEKPIYIECRDPEQIILVDMFCNEPFDNAEYINPFTDNNKYPRNQEEYDGGRNAEPRHIRAFMRYQDIAAPLYGGRHVVYWYASMLVFWGSNTLQVLAVDDNFHRYLYMEHPELNGGVQGGIGLFGSVCGRQYQLEVVKE